MEPSLATGAFTSIREIGRGGMGVVYLVKDHKRGDLCAAKLLHDQLSLDETVVARFQTEARKASEIKHPAICQVRGDVERLPDGRWYYLMEFVEGVTLRQLVAQHGALSLALIIDICAPLADALDLAHASGLVHRDLKPDNVMVTYRADTQDPVLLDFGIAKLVDEPSVTRPGAAVGTVAYTAPEQARGEPVTYRTDVYALGVLVYQMITGGHLPFDAADGALYHLQMTQPPVDPRRRHPGVPDAAVGPILAAISADPMRRPSAGGFLLMLAGTLVGKTPLTDGMAIVQRKAPRLLVGSNLSETLRAPGLAGGRSITAWTYDYGDVLGEGGFGQVLRGVKRGTGGFSLPVAIKRILPEHAKSAEFVEMFHQEARVAAILSTHPNNIKVIDHAVDPEGAPVIVMELVDGVDLEKLRLSGPLPYSVIIYILTEALEGLAFAHDLPPLGPASPGEVAQRAALRGVIHRDLSHHNLMVSRHGAVKVLDFGIAKLREHTEVKGSARIVGKAGYLSPEQAASAKTIDHRSDLYAIGIILWELLTGKRLHVGDTWQDCVLAAMFGVVDPPRLHNDQVPPELEAIAMRLLERQPHLRFSSSRETADALLASPLASRSARVELQQLIRERFPRPEDSAAAVPSRPASNSPQRLASSPQLTPVPSAVGSSNRPTSVPTAAPAPITVTARRGVTSLRLVGAVAIGAAVAALAVSLRTRRTPDGKSSVAAVPAVRLPAVGAVPPSPSPTTQPAPLVIAAPAPTPSAARPATTVVVVTQPDAMIEVRDETGRVAAGRSPLTFRHPQGAQLQVRAQLIGFTPLTTSITTTGTEQSITVVLHPVRPAAPPTTNKPRPKDLDGDKIID